MKAVFFFMALVVLFLSPAQPMVAQSVNINLTVAPPYSVQVEDILKMKGQVVVTVTNKTNSPLKIKLLATLQGDKGIKGVVKPSFQPTSPISLSPLETRVLSGAQVQALNPNLTENDIVYTGIDKSQIAQTGLVPEGIYTICLRAFDYQNSQPLSAEGLGCATIFLTHFDPPVIVQPQDKSTVEQKTPQYLLFSWTPSGIGGLSRYRFEIVDLTMANLQNPMEAFETPGMIPFFKRENLLTTTFPYDITMPTLTPNHQYAVRVTAYDPTKKLSYKNKGASPILVFQYKKSGGGIVLNNPNLNNANNGNNNQNNQPDPPNGACVATTQYNTPLSNSAKSGIPSGTDIAVGKFVMKNTQFTKNGATYDGTGEILVNFLHTKLKVAFSGIQINADNRVFSGKIIAQIDAQTLVNEAMSKTKEGLIETLPNAAGLANELKKAARQISKLTPEGVAKALPLSLDNAQANIGIVGAIFEPTEAYLNMVLATPVPQALSGDYLNIASKGIAIQPNGFGVAGVKINLAHDLEVDLSNKVALKFLGGANKTFAEIDCEGFNGLTINGAFVLDRAAALPVNNQLKVINDPSVKVQVPFTINSASVQDWLVDNLAFSHKFSIPDAPDFVVESGSASFDFSAKANSPSFETAFPNFKNKKDWLGLFIKNLSLILPKGFKNGQNTEGVKIGVQNVYIDKQGLTGTFFAEGKPLKAGQVAGWDFELTKVDLKIDKSTLGGGGFAGNLTLPLGETTQLGFSATVAKGNTEGADVNLTVVLGTKLEAEFFLAKISLLEGSSVELLKEGDKYAASAKLNGKIGIAFDKKPANANVSNLKIPELEFQELRIDGKDQANYVPKFDIKFASLANMDGLQAKIGESFELEINKLSFQKAPDGKSMGLTLGMGIALFGGENNQSSGAGGGTEFTIWAKHNGSFFKYDKATLGAIKIDCDLSVAKLKGEIQIFDQDPTFGNGFRGAVDAQLGGLNAGLKVAVQFGRTLANKGNYKYFYFDAMLESGMGIPIPGTVAALYGLGGGAYCNMKRTGADGILAPNAYKPVAGGSDGAPTTSGAVFMPQKDIAGFHASVLFGMAGTKQAFNGDMKFSMEFNAKTLAVNFIRLDGNAYVMQNPVKPRSPEGAMLYCGGFLEVNPVNREFFGSLAVKLNVLELIKGGGTTAFKFKLPKKDNKGNVVDEQGLKWFIKIGYWTPQYDPFEDPNRLNATIGFENAVVEFNVKFQTYFMIGNDLPNGLPPLPSYILNMFEQSGMYAPKKKDLAGDVSNTQSLAFAWGAGLQLNAGFDFKIVSAHLTAEACADVLLANVQATCGGKDMGFAGGWYAKGQAYAYVKGDAKVFGLEVAEFAAAAVLQVEMPNPTWIRGDVVAYIKILGHPAGDYHGSFERGKRCEDIETNMDPFAYSKLIKGATPANKAKDVNPFKPNLSADFYYKNGEVVNVFNSVKGYSDGYKFSATVELLDKNNKVVPIEKPQYAWTYANHFEITPLSNLADKSTYTLKINAQFTFYKDNKWVIEKAEELKTSFTTGEKPSKITDNYIVDAYPLPNQRYAMKQHDNGSPTVAQMKMKYDLTYLISGNEKVVVRLTELGTNKVFNIDATIFAENGPLTTIRWAMPPTLGNRKFYQLQMFAKNTKTQAEDILYDGYTFRTSGFDNMKAKLATYQLKRVAYLDNEIQVNKTIGGDVMSNKATIYTPVLLMTGGENLEHYDINVQKSHYNNWTWDLGGYAFADNQNTFNWLYQQKQKFHDFTTAQNLTAQEKAYLQSLPKLQTVKRPTGFPYEGKTADPFTQQNDDFTPTPDLIWMKNNVIYEAQLKSNNQLAGNESIKQVDAPLSSQEIAAAKNNNGGGWQGGNGDKGNGSTAYMALMDFSTFTAYWDKANSDAHLLQKASTQNKYLVFNALDKLGWPLLSQNQTAKIWGEGGHGTAHILNWQYKPPVQAANQVKF